MIDEFAAPPAEAKAQLTILGDGQCRATLEEQAARLGLSSRVTFAGSVENVFPSLWEAEFYLSTSVSEGMSKSNAPENSLYSLKIVKYNSAEEAIVAYVLV
ncbi:MULTISPECIES: glycosyltransferase [unclassified Mesorhizobium]|uniref:glycosyltransferase n=1 Tax=unclassified Mesorhizobium TaxID=325217 RepID=UPI000FD354BA|nr:MULTISPECIES: glycosyltransferase [unclassified Mesorhizobium]RUV98035.1 glycosyltransferase [Mesorhizobium sp. M5C.F.Ca.IN.020.14.1.1]RUV32109.1 glycosyltransferase [Mesorhizobium sp. M5C.F.Ca.IN.020.32.2.1]RWG51769.1 MAG: glycosyltransferase [Mesorhizobium sp.]RWH51148.1 MAG: glycosyltransferase [Mesorhizobium sp.]RWH59154.1 MAG: glycosyltransferase [Mesorhizobium sp.]